MSMTANVKSDPAGLVEYITRNLAKNKDEVIVSADGGGSSLLLELKVHPEDLGTVIGKGGRIAKSIRNLLNSISVKKVTSDGHTETYQKINLDIIDKNQ